MVTFQKGLIGILRKHGRKGRLVAVQGILKTREFADSNTGEKRWTTEILLNPIHSQVQFFDKLEDAPGQNDTPPPDQLSDADHYNGDDLPF